ncbi:MAG: LuxR family transcriptional regulator [Sphingomonadaceae bacterium]
MQNILVRGRPLPKRSITPPQRQGAPQKRARAEGSDPGELHPFLNRLSGANSQFAIQECLHGIARHYGFDNFHLCRFSVADLSAEPTLIGDLPEPFLQDYIVKKSWRADPFATMSQGRATPFSWREAPAVTQAMKEFRAEMARFGAADGWVIPWHIPGAWSGFCNFSISADRTLPETGLPALQYLAVHAADALNRLDKQREHPALRLTPRQLQCVILAARGKSDWVSGQLLGLSPATVHKYLEQAKARYDVASRTELVVRALYDKQISFTDLLN